MTAYELIQEAAQFPPDAKVIVEVIGDRVCVYNHRTDCEDCVDFEDSSDNPCVIPGKSEKELVLKVGI